MAQEVSFLMYGENTIPIIQGTTVPCDTCTMQITESRQRDMN